MTADLQRAWHFYQRGELAEAEAEARQAAEASPADPRVATLQGAICLALGRRGEAVEHYRRAAQLAPDDAALANNLGVALAQAGSLCEAGQWFRRSAELSPSFAQAHNNLGNCLRQLGHLEDGETSLRRALMLQPDFIDAHFNLGLVHLRQERFAEAEGCLRRVLQSRPDHLSARRQLGLALLRQYRLQEAAGSFEAVLQQRPDHVDALNDLGDTRRKQGRYQEALECFNRGLALQPDHAVTHHNRALLRLLLGDYEQGWAEYEWRWRCPDFPPLPVHQPAWSGSSLAGRTILLHMEQGLGDAIQLARYAALVKQQGATVLLACRARMGALLATAEGIDRVFEEGEPWPFFDVHAPLASLPYLCHTTLATVPARVPYLYAEPALRAKWRQELGAVKAFKVGLCWQGSRGNRDDSTRSITLDRFAPLAAVDGVRLYSLQKGYGSEQLAPLAGPLGIVDLGTRLDESTGAFVETAAVLENLDLAITCDSAVAHLAGALNRPTWVALAYAADYRWMLEREDSPWYPSLRLFRQPSPGDWQAVFARMAGALSKLTQSRGGPFKGVRTPG